MSNTNDPKVTRRTFSKAVIAGAASAMGLDRALAQPAAGRPRALEKELVFSGRGGSLGGTWRTKVIPPFERKFDCKVTYVTNDSVPAVAKVIAERAAPQTDVIWATDQTHVQGKVSGVFAKLDFDRIPNAANCHDFARYADGFGIVWSIGGCVLQFNSKIYREQGLAAPAAWSDVFIPKTKGRVAWFDLSTLQGLTAFLMINKLQGGNENNVSPGFKFLKDQLPNVLALISSPAQMDDLFQQNEAWIAPNIDGRALALKSKGFPVEFVHPREGVPQIGLQLDLIKGAPHPNLAHEFINWVLSEEMQAVIGNEMGLGPVNKNTKLDAKAAQTVMFGPERVAKLVQFDYETVIRDFPKWLDRWNRELSK